ncbi:hypothetical protein CGUA_07865 [Corynebacterium guangdongense]|nr:hypothetical protein CGUA_07865 [Corynebacterium guangdongense]
MDPAALSFPTLNPIRREIATELAALPVDEALGVLGISEKLRREAESNQRLFTSPTMPAILRYTGVLYDALEPATLPTWDRLAIGSALFGVVGAGDPIPHYRLSGGTKLGGRTLKSRFGSSITEALDDADGAGLVLDLRSGAYQALGRLKRAVTVRVETPDGKVVSHFNKFHKGLLARHLADKDAASAEEVVELARAAGMDMTLSAPAQLTLVVESATSSTN